MSKVFQVSVTYMLPTSELVTFAAPDQDAAIDFLMNALGHCKDVEIHQIHELVDNTPPDYDAQVSPKGKPQLRIVN